MFARQVWGQHGGLGPGARGIPADGSSWPSGAAQPTSKALPPFRVDPRQSAAAIINLFLVDYLGSAPCWVNSVCVCVCVCVRFRLFGLSSS